MKTILINIKYLLPLVLFLCTAVNSQWVNVSPPGNDTAFYCIDIVSQNVAYAGKGSHGIIIKTTNGGINWQEINTPSEYMANKIHFINETTGFLATGSGLYKTNSGGAAWVTLSAGSFSDLFFVSESTGYAINADFPAKLYKTTNGGGNFSIFNMGSYPSYIGQALCYVNSAEIFALTFKPAADSSLIFKCTNWDSGWVPVLKTKPACYDISFADANTGIVCGNFGVFRRTTDGGTTWQNQTPAGGTTILACKMNNLSTGYFVCGAGFIYKSTNNGASWFPQNSGTSFMLYDIDILSNDSASFAAGEFGTILKTGNGSVTLIEPQVNNSPNSYILEQNFPNPFNPETKIKFSIENEGNVSLNVYDITGKLVNEMLNERLPGGVHEVSFNASGLPSGIYFYCMEANGTKLSKKMILAK